MLALGRATGPWSLGSKRPFLSWCQQRFPAELRWRCCWKAGDAWRGSQGVGALRSRVEGHLLRVPGRCSPAALHPHLSAPALTLACAHTPRNPHTRVNVHPHAHAHTGLEDLGTPDLVSIALRSPSVTSPMSSCSHLLKGVTFLMKSSGCAVICLTAP